ncbi:glycerophosphodiester phosphodiesterase, partial [Butyricicoccus sp. 1XD8-22]
NTKAAFDAAYHEHAQGFELDVHLTKDGEVVICHDDKIDRTSNGSGFIKDYTVEELKSFDFAAKFPVNDLYRHTHAEQIMTLREYFEWLDGKNIETNIELKT